MTQGLLATMIADTAPEDLRGTAYDVFNLVSGLAMLVASLLWDQFGARFMFVGGRLFAAVALLNILMQGRTARRESSQ